MPDEPAYKGKIGRLPVAIRNEVNRRLHENEVGTGILEWLNAEPRVLEVLDKYFHEQPISPQNLSEWRQGGYQDWLKRQEEVERLKDLSDHALRLGQAAGGNISDGSAAIAGGRLMATLEGLEGKELADAIYALSALRMGDQEKEKIQIRREVLRQREEIIDLKRKEFQRKTCELLIKYSEDKRAKDILESRASNSEKIEQLGQAIFGEDWE
jgi:hypothetical protein